MENKTSAEVVHYCPECGYEGNPIDTEDGIECPKCGKGMSVNWRRVTWWDKLKGILK